MTKIATHEREGATALKAAADLRKTNLKSSRPRLGILTFLIDHHGPFTLEEVHQKVKKQGCDLATVYRCLAAFQAAGLVRRVDFGDGTSRFEYEGEGAEHHHHVICRVCGQVKNLDYCIVEGIEKMLKKEGYLDVAHSLEFFGTCANCATSSRTRNRP